MKHSNKIPRQKKGKPTKFKDLQKPFEIGRSGKDWSGARERTTSKSTWAPGAGK